MKTFLHSSNPHTHAYANSNPHSKQPYPFLSNHIHLLLASCYTFIDSKSLREGEESIGDSLLIKQEPKANHITSLNNIKKHERKKRDTTLLLPLIGLQA